MSGAQKRWQEDLFIVGEYIGCNNRQSRLEEVFTESNKKTKLENGRVTKSGQAGK